jgi:hypothetical protein
MNNFVRRRRKRRHLSLEDTKHEKNVNYFHEFLSFQIIDLNFPTTTCNNLPDIPNIVISAFGGLGFQDKPMFCDGMKNPLRLNKCYSLKENGWTSSPGLNTEKYGAAVSPSPYPSGDQKFFVTGGKHHLFRENSSLNTVEVLTEEGWKTLPQTLPVTISNHCSVLVNSTTVMVIGGVQNGRQSSDTYLFNTENEVWTKGPQLSTIRSYASCGRIRKDSQSQEFSIIVAGGFYGDLTKLSSVEILDLGSNEWRAGPSLPLEIQGAEMVEYQNGEVILVSGGSYPKNQLIFQLRGADANWTKMEQMLKRNPYTGFAFAFLVPDSIAQCA